jgi:hypothetical protein
MSNLIDKLNKSDFAKLPIKKDRTPISAGDFDHKKLQVTPQKLEKGRGGVLGSGLGSGLGGFTPSKNYTKTTRRR